MNHHDTRREQNSILPKSIIEISIFIIPLRLQNDENKEREKNSSTLTAKKGAKSINKSHFVTNGLKCFISIENKNQ
jgi:hypothetical protein